MKRILTIIFLLTGAALGFARAESDIQLYNEIKQSFNNGFYPGAVSATEELQNSFHNPNAKYIHDVYEPLDPPYRKAIPIEHVGDRIGQPYVSIPK